MSARLWLVRHGATDWSDAGRLNGWTDVPLNERGRAQATWLAGQLKGREFAGVWSSDLARAEETARLVLGQPVPDRRLRELDFGALEGRRWEEISAEVQRALITFDGFEAPEGESVAELDSRVFRFLQELPRGEHLVVTHGGVIRTLLRRSGNDLQPAPGELVRLNLNGRDPRRAGPNAMEPDTRRARGAENSRGAQPTVPGLV
jgi:broad specificity phosphatase PhoE